MYIQIIQTNSLNMIELIKKARVSGPAVWNPVLGPITLVDHVWFRVQSLAVRPRVAEHDEAENGRKSYSHSQAACSDQHPIPDTELGVLISASNLLHKNAQGE